MADAAGRRPLPAPSRQMRVIRRAPDGTQTEALWGIAAETPVEININSRPLAVMMATPADVEDLALGFALSETILTDPAAVQGFDVQVLPEGVVVDMRADPAMVSQSRIRPRFLEGMSGCGLCGVERLADTIRDIRPRARMQAQEIPVAAVLAAFAALPGAQALNRATRSVHAAAWAAPDGEILMVREDVGRHNALDKLIGARARAGASLSDPGFVVMSSRCSFELVQKCAVAGAAMLATVSAPTGLALALAQAAGLRVAVPGGDALMEFE